MRKGKGIISLVLAAMIALSVMAAAGTAAAAGTFESEYEYELYGMLFANNFYIAEDTYSAVCGIPALYQLLVNKNEELSSDYKYQWEPGDATKQLGFELMTDEEGKFVYLAGTEAQIENAKKLVGKTVFTLTISKNGGAVMAKVKCVLESLVYGAEWENHQEIVEEIEFTPGKPITISLPQDRIASTGDNATLIYEWGRDLGDYDETYGSGKGLTSITFTPDAGWDENFVYAYVYREDLPDQLFDLGIEYELKISSTTGSGTTGSAPKTGDETPLALLVSLAAVSAGACLLLLRRRHA